MNTKIKVAAIILGVALCSFGIPITTSIAASLNLSKAPLFMGEVVTPNVFFEVDDSGSMDWETLTRKYWYYTTYWRNAGSIFADTGRWKTYSDSGPCRGSRQDYSYIFSNSDDKYSSCGLGATLQDQPESVVRDWRVRSADFNVLYFDPSVTYQPWGGKDANGNDFTNASFTSARSNPQPGTNGYSDTRNLTGFVYEVWSDSHGFDGAYPKGPASANSQPNGVIDLWDNHVRYTVNASNITVETFTHDPDPSETCNLSDAQDNPPYDTCFRTQVNATTISGSQAAAIKQNIANWYQYYRRRAFVAKAAITGVLEATPNYRYGLSLINRYDPNNKGVFVEVPDETNTNFVDYPTHDQIIIDDFLSYEWRPQGTPLRTALQRTGNYFDHGAHNFGKTDPIIHACQQNFAILFTDGYWNGGNPSVGDRDRDSISNTLADVAKKYYDTDLSPLDDDVPTNAFDLADWQHMVTFTVAFGVQGDLVDTDGDGWPDTDAAGNIPNPWPTEAGNWGDPTCSDCPEKIDDMWHAAYNSRGDFLSAKNPQDLIQGLQAILGGIGTRLASASSVALNSGAISSESHLYQAKFTSGDWFGQLLSFAVNTDGSLAPNWDWDAGVVINTQDFNTGREIITFKPTLQTGVPFRWPSSNPITDPTSNSEIDYAQVQALMINPDTAVNDGRGEDRLEYLRGKRVQTGNNVSDFRPRITVLGDIVHSSPTFVGAPNNIFPSDWDDLTVSGNENTPEDTKPYAIWRNTHRNRQRIVYAGANDGMLHGFDAGTYDNTSREFSSGTGAEKIAYVPSKLYSKLNQLTFPDYRHEYYVDSTVTVMDAFFDGAWHTVLVGGLGGGGQALYALDITDPTQFAESNAGSLVLWEFDDQDDSTTAEVDGDRDLGFTYYQPANVVRMHDGKWHVVFGNGYDNTENDAQDGDGDGSDACADQNDPAPCTESATGNAVLYIIDLATGGLEKKLDTGKGMSDDPRNANFPNGLSTVAPVDIDGDFVVDFIYGGDLFGNLWKFDVTSTDPNDWTISFVDGQGRFVPLFKATAADANLTPQPITQRPVVGNPVHHRQGSGRMVYFGTGRYIEVGDNVPTGQTTQSFYSIWDRDIERQVNPPDRNQSSLARSDLLEQKVSSEATVNRLEWRVVTNEPITWRPDPQGNTDYLGWYLDLINQDPAFTLGNLGERSISDPILRNGRIIFTTLVPSQNPCDFGGTGWLMELDAANGGRLPFSPFDVNGDSTFTVDDFVSSGGAVVPVTGVKSPRGIPTTPGIFSVRARASGNGVYQGGGGGGGGGSVVIPPDVCPPGEECKKISTSSGEIFSVGENAADDVGRQNWRQIR